MESPYSDVGEVAMTKGALLEGIEWEDFMTPLLTDSLVGKRVVVRILQYEVREGREAGEVVVVSKAFIAKRDSSFILLEVR